MRDTYGQYFRDATVSLANAAAARSDGCIHRRDLPADELYLTVGNVMARSGHCREWVSARIKDGRIPAVRVKHGGGHFAYLVAESAYLLYAYSIQEKETH